MSRMTRYTWLLVVQATALVLILLVSAANSDELAPPISPPAPSISPPAPGDLETLDDIRNALGGQADSSASDDGILQDVLKFARRRGSLLKGTQLDPKSEFIVVQEASANETPQTGAVNSHALMAETLLRTARLLEQRGLPSDRGADDVASLDGDPSLDGDALLPVSVLVKQLRLRAADSLRRAVR